MQNFDLYLELARLLTPEGVAVVLSALPQNPLAWQRLQEPAFFELAAGQCGKEFTRWSPARLALLALKTGQTPEMLNAGPMVEVEPALAEPMIQVYQNARVSASGGPATLEEAGLLALALRERRRKSENWNFLAAEIHARTGPQGEIPALWRSALACLYGFVSDSEGLLRTLLPTSGKQSFEWLVHTLISQPVEPLALVELLAGLLKASQLEVQLGVLRRLSLHSRGDLAQKLAETLTVDHPAFSTLRSQTGLSHLSLATVAMRAFVLQQLAALYQVGGNQTQAVSLLQSAESALKHWTAGLYLQEANLASENGDPALQDESRLNVILGQARRLEGELGAVMGGQSLSPLALKEVPTDLDDPVLQIRQAVQLAAQGESVLARNLAGQATSRLIERIEKAGLPFWGEFVYEWSPLPVLKALVGLGLAREALDLARALISVRSADASLLNEASLICEHLNNLGGARQYAQAAAGLQPGKHIWRRRLGQLSMAAGDWYRAVVEYEAVLALSPEPSIADRLALAQASLNSGLLERVVEVCDAILKEQPDHGTAAGLLGRALAAQGDLDRAVFCLSRATRHAPEEPAPWLALAEIQRGRGEPQRALETLRSAVLAIPETAPEAGQANLALGELCLQAGLLSEALPALKLAYHLEPRSRQAAYLYGKTLRESGKPVEARSVLETTRPAWNEHREMAYAYALVARELHDLSAMLSALEIALRFSSRGTWDSECQGEFGWDRVGDAQARQPVEWHLLYIRALMGDLFEFEPQVVFAAMPPEARLYRVEQSVGAVLAQEPAHYEARFYKAQLRIEHGEADEALALFRSLVEIRSIPEHELYWRVQWGIGRASLRLGYVDTALAAFKEAAHSHPDSLYLQRDLAEACLQADLPQEALSAAQYALQLAPDQVFNLVWFAGFVAPLGEKRAALETLECAVQIEPNRPELRTGLAEWQIAAGNLAAARAHLESLNHLNPVNSDILRRAADLYLLMDDPQAALACLERTVDQEAAPAVDLLLDVARLQERLGRDEKALLTIQKALAAPARGQARESIPLYLLQTNLLHRLGRGQAALASLEKVLRIAEELRLENPQEAAWLREELGEIHERYSSLQMEMGNLAEAAYHAEKALELIPGRVPLRYKAASLALATLQMERAAKMAWQVETDHLGIACLKVEIGLEMEAETGLSPEALEAAIDNCLARFPQEPRVMAAHSRILARRRDWGTASSRFEEVLDQLSGAGRNGLPELWLAEAALETHHWMDALRFFEAYLQQNAGELRGYFAYARALVLSAEQRRLCEALDCRAHTPDKKVLEEDSRQKFEQAIQMAARLANNQGPSALQIQQWRARGQAVFQPSVQAARDLAALPASPQNIAALVAVLGQLGRRSHAIQVALRFSEDPGTRMQLALCSTTSSELLEGVENARKLVADLPENPLHHALLAYLEKQSGNAIEALAAYENALRLWPGEAGWHDSAGDLAFKLDDCLSGMTHREQALALDPINITYALKLGEACLSSEGASRAVEVLEMAIRVDKNRAELWLAIAEAYRQAGRMPEALEAARFFSELNVTSGQGYLLAAETSLTLGQGDQALEYARKAVLREPENADALLFLVHVLDHQSRMEEAIELLEKAPIPVANSFRVAFERARLIYQSKGATAALEVLEKLSVEYPDEATLLAFLAFTQFECGNMRSAERSGFKSLRLNPNQPELALMLGRLQHKAGQLDQAVYLLSEAVRMAPTHHEALLELATVFQERREPAMALQTFRQVMRMDSNDHRAFYQSGLILRDSKDYAGAEAMLRRAVDLAPNNAGIRRQLLAVIALNLVHNKQEVVTRS